MIYLLKQLNTYSKNKKKQINIPNDNQPDESVKETEILDKNNNIQATLGNDVNSTIDNSVNETANSSLSNINEKQADETISKDLSEVNLQLKEILHICDSNGEEISVIELKSFKKFIKQAGISDENCQDYINYSLINSKEIEEKKKKDGYVVEIDEPYLDLIERTK